MVMNHENKENAEILIFNILQNNEEWMSRSSRHQSILQCTKNEVFY